MAEQAMEDNPFSERAMFLGLMLCKRFADEA
jgi:hypothetical protein